MKLKKTVKIATITLGSILFVCAAAALCVNQIMKNEARKEFETKDSEHEAARVFLLETNRLLSASLAKTDDYGIWKFIQEGGGLSNMDFIEAYESCRDANRYGNCSLSIASFFDWRNAHKGDRIGSYYDLDSLELYVIHQHWWSQTWDSLEDEFLRKSYAYGINRNLNEELQSLVDLLVQDFPKGNDRPIQQGMARIYSQWGVGEICRIRKSVLENVRSQGLDFDESIVYTERQFVDCFKIRLYQALTGKMSLR